MRFYRRLTRVQSLLGCRRSFSSADVKPLMSASEAVASANSFKFIDASWFMGGGTRDPDVEFEAERIVGARRLDFDALSDQNSDLPHMLPPPSMFNEWAQSNGITRDCDLIIYGSAESFSAPRVWWMFHAFQHAGSISILNGGLEAWKAAGGALESGPVSSPLRTEYASPGVDPKLVVGSADVLDVMMTGKAQLCDARSAARFSGEVDEPRPGLARGHIPGSLNVPFTTLLESGDTTKFISPHEVKAAMRKAGVVPGSKVIMTCGSGVTACTLAFGMVMAGQAPADVPVYDGSWSEWGRPDLTDLPKMVTDGSE